VNESFYTRNGENTRKIKKKNKKKKSFGSRITFAERAVWQLLLCSDEDKKVCVSFKTFKRFYWFITIGTLFIILLMFIIFVYSLVFNMCREKELIFDTYDSGKGKVGVVAQ